MCAGQGCHGHRIIVAIERGNHVAMTQLSNFHHAQPLLSQARPGAAAQVMAAMRMRMENVDATDEDGPRLYRRRPTREIGTANAGRRLGGDLANSGTYEKRGAGPDTLHAGDVLLVPRTGRCVGPQQLRTPQADVLAGFATPNLDATRGSTLVAELGLLQFGRNYARPSPFPLPVYAPRPRHNFRHEQVCYDGTDGRAALA